MYKKHIEEITQMNNKDKEIQELIIGIVVLIIVVAIHLALNLFVYPFVLFSLGNLVWNIPFLNYQVAWIITKVVVLLLKKSK